MTKHHGIHTYTPEQMKILFEAMNIAPSWMSKRFIMRELCGWSDEKIAENVMLRTEEETQSQRNNKIGGYR